MQSVVYKVEVLKMGKDLEEDDLCYKCGKPQEDHIERDIDGQIMMECP